MTTQEVPALVLGPMLRYVDETTATIWVETSGPAEVSILGHTSATFAVGSHHYALVVVDSLSAGADVEYSVALDGTTVWPQPDDARPAPRIRTLEPGRELDIVFGSCRIGRPNIEPWILDPGTADDAVGVDALLALALRLRRNPGQLPDLLLMLGDQIYADKPVSPRALDTMDRPRPPGTPPPDAAANFEQFAWLHQHNWSQPDVRWLLSTVPSAMIFDDHEVQNHWNISARWRQHVMQETGWAERITGAYLAYWLYQHMGNLPPSALEEEGLWPALLASPDGERRLREFAAHADDEVNGTKRSRWSYCRQLGRTRLVMLDTRSGRVLENGRRSMLGDAEWDIVEQWLRGDCDHLLIGSSLPFLLERSVHHVEAWNEAVAEGMWGERAARWGERIRIVGNLEHWAAFQRSFRRLSDAVGEVATGRRGAAPATVMVLSGDVHHSYVAHVDRPAGRLPVVQLVSSPLRSHYPSMLKQAFIIADSRFARLLGRILTTIAGLPPHPLKWRVTAGPLFGNHIASLRLSPRAGVLRMERARQHKGAAVLQLVHQETIGTDEAGRAFRTEADTSRSEGALLLGRRLLGSGIDKLRNIRPGPPDNG
ncbi:alkaline phosphatase D family protein [Arthrobacter castelli]|uniref:alkaline phosphatase D family protein n=1 Tax=Arthrobacter castelli TaxID=271431 RepID=UPI000412EDF8|nr:alkaline phosphatase D family protein [Arthrobacter castelli]